MKKVIEKISLNLGNRDGDLYAVKAGDGKFYLVLDADTFHNEEQFEGTGSTVDVEITEAAFHSLANVKVMATPLAGASDEREVKFEVAGKHR